MFEQLQYWAQRWGWRSEGVELKQLQEAGRRGARIGVFQDAGRTEWWQPEDKLPDTWLPLTHWSEPADVDALILITDRLLPTSRLSMTAILRPRTLTLGITGPDTGDVEELQEAVYEVCEAHGWAVNSLTAVATVQGDAGTALFEEWAERREIPLLAYPPARLSILPGTAQVKVEDNTAWHTQVVAMLAAGVSHCVVPATRCGAWCLALARRRTG
ncbi:MAG: cobalamin biosynthesis protein [Gemmatales bacterium]|nr:cobalamin biosynthesis protein [Gemmatales bacterium]MDW7993700.1 cobalamin biosynthesis protein [Gemmatales bacterium]